MDNWIAHQIILLVFLMFPLSIALWNSVTYRHLGDYRVMPRTPKVSVLVPARNEEGNIEQCIGSLLEQEYPDFQVIALDDNSTDGTWRVLEKLAARNDRLTLVKGKPLPKGWLGKHWACHQLALIATGELLLFTDADTCHKPQALRHAVSALLSEDTGLLSVLPHQQVRSWAERLAIPVVWWSIFSFLPLALAYRLKAPRLSFANGQFMLFSRHSYELIGGHAAVKNTVVDDLALVRNIKSANLRWRILDGKNYVRCRMYRNFRQVVDGLSKNLFAAFDYNIPVYVFIWLWLGLVFIEPPAVILSAFLGFGTSSFSTVIAWSTIAVSLFLWTLSYRQFHFPLWQVLLYPITISFFILIALRSMAVTLSGKRLWKERTI